VHELFPPPHGPPTKNFLLSTPPQPSLSPPPMIRNYEPSFSPRNAYSDPFPVPMLFELHPLDFFPPPISVGVHSGFPRIFFGRPVDLVLHNALVSYLSQFAPLPWLWREESRWFSFPFGHPSCLSYISFFCCPLANCPFFDPFPFNLWFFLCDHRKVFFCVFCQNRTVDTCRFLSCGALQRNLSFLCIAFFS